MTQLLKKALVYQEAFVPGRRDGIAVLRNLLDAGLVRDYVLYESPDEVRIAANALAEASLVADAVSLRFNGTSAKEAVSDPFKQIESLLGELDIADWCAYGWIGFDVARYYSAYTRQIDQPIVHLIIPEVELRLDSRGVRVRSVRPLAEILEVIAREAPPLDYVPTPPPMVGDDRAEYERQVRQLTGAIRSGHLHKAILSRSVKFRGNLDVPGTYVVAGRANTAVRSYCLQAGDVRAVGFSPEILMLVSADGQVITNPLAGTRPRAADSDEDARLNGELFTDAKEVKEHALSIWLAQSEIASVCREGSTRIYDFMEVKRYRTVQHLSSRVGGRLDTGRTLWDALSALFPGITVSGIDKPRALEWIDRLEGEPRGLYAGAIGWVDSDGRADLAIAIRSVYQYGETIALNAGAGIVAESLPEREYMESVHKMNTMRTQLVLEQ